MYHESLMNLTQGLMPESIGALVRGKRPKPKGTPPSHCHGMSPAHRNISWPANGLAASHHRNTGHTQGLRHGGLPTQGLRCGGGGTQRHRRTGSSTQALAASRPASCGAAAAVLARAALSTGASRLHRNGACPPGTVSYRDLFSGANRNSTHSKDHHRSNATQRGRSGGFRPLSETLSRPKPAPAGRGTGLPPLCTDLTGDKEDAVGVEGGQGGGCLDDVSGEEEGEGLEEGEGCEDEDEAEEGETTDGDDDTCQVCNLHGDLLVCDGCEQTFHAACVGLEVMPEEEDKWFCPTCVDCGKN